MKLITWNINSVRLRLPLLEKLIKTEKPDVICLQEIKVVNELFPAEAIAKLGYPHQHVYGMKGYNGVAILSKTPFRKTFGHDWCDKQDARHISVHLDNGIELHNVYVPAGGDIPDVKANPKFAHKLDFIDSLMRHADKQKKGTRILVGDLNVAPLEHDVWSHKQLLDVVSHTPVEVEKFTRWQQAGAWFDAPRRDVPENEKLYSWWSYRARDWEISNRGRRLDHVWLSPDLAPQLTGTRILREARGWGAQPSDHVPVIAIFDL